MSQIVQMAFEGRSIDFRSDGWFNATVAAAYFEKQPTDWLYRRDTVRYIEALSRTAGNSGFLKELNENNGLDGSSAASKARLLRLVKSSGLVSVKGGSPSTGGGTWLHPKLAVAFARWLSVEFEVWCDVQIDRLIKGDEDRARARHEAASSHKVMCRMLEAARLAEGKETKPHHYVIECKLVNWSVGAGFEALNRDQMTAEQLDALSNAEIQNAVMIGSRLPYDERKGLLGQQRTLATPGQPLPRKLAKRRAAKAA